MEQLPNGFTLNLPEGAFPLSTDSMVLSHFVRLPKKRPGAGSRLRLRHTGAAAVRRE